MKYHIRKVKTGSNNIAVQVIRYINRKRVIEKHIGSAHNQGELRIQLDDASKWITGKTKQMPLFPEEETFVSLDQFEYLGFQYTFLLTSSG